MKKIKTIITALFLLLSVQLCTAQNPSVRNGGVTIPYVAPYVKNDNSITIYGKVYWHYVEIDGTYYNCKDRVKITQAIIKLVEKSKRKSKTLPPVIVKDRIKPISPRLLRDPSKSRKGVSKNADNVKPAL